MMANKDGFGSGLVVGAAIGGLVGALIGASLASRSEEDEVLESGRDRRRMRGGRGGASLESARQGLEGRIAQLNEAIDDVRSQLGTPMPMDVENGGRSEPAPRSQPE
ncbi:MAG: hypothetical protein AAGA67_04595 [Cyanobacteria bacterium P01_F01_bin.153]